jgi:hypothetical protein
LSIVALLEADSRHRHYAKVSVGEIDLIARQRFLVESIKPPPKKPVATSGSLDERPKMNDLPPCELERRSSHP